MSKVERNSLGEIIMPIDLVALTAARVKLTEKPQRFLEAFEFTAAREALILDAVGAYLRSLPKSSVDQLIPVLAALGEENVTHPQDA